MGPWVYAQDVFSMQRSNSHIRVFTPPVGQAGLEPAVWAGYLWPIYSRLPSPLGALTLVDVIQLLESSGDRARTCNLGIRSPPLYPLSYTGSE